MLIQIINSETPQRLLEFVEQCNANGTSWGLLYLPLHSIETRPGEEMLLHLVRPALADRQASLYLMDDGDALVAWIGGQKSVFEALRYALNAHPHIAMIAHEWRRFDSLAHAEELRQFCRTKLSPAPRNELERSTPSMPAPLTETLRVPTEEQRGAFAAIARGRRQRPVPQILVVEDQAFSSKLLLGMLARRYQVQAVPSARLAFDHYLRHAPDILLLDIDLPDTSGHTLATAIKSFDQEAHIVMVTANNYAEDVVRAKANGAKGFIIKPYSKKKITEAIEAYPYKRTR